VIAAHLLWWFERRSHPEEMQTYRAGIGHALWWAAVTVIGFDEKPPATLAGRLMALIWMFAGIFIIANLTATLTAGATLRGLRGEINDVSDLRTHQVAAITATTSAEYLANNGIAYTPVERVEDAYELLRAGDVDAVVYDAPVLRYYVKTEGRGEIQVVGQIFEPEKYGIALPSDSPHRESINQAILRVQESGAYQDIYNRWFGAN
jgi:ABC-type amino acid transport substrate-binding protein